MFVFSKNVCLFYVYNCHHLPNIFLATFEILMILMQNWTT